MKDKAQLSFLANENPVSAHPVIYVPPTIEEVNTFAHGVCLELAQRTKTSPPNAEVMRGFATFVREVVSTHVSYLNRYSYQVPGGSHAAKEKR